MSGTDLIVDAGTYQPPSPAASTAAAELVCAVSDMLTAAPLPPASLPPAVVAAVTVGGGGSGVCPPAGPFDWWLEVARQWLTGRHLIEIAIAIAVMLITLYLLWIALVSVCSFMRACISFAKVIRDACHAFIKVYHDYRNQKLRRRNVAEELREIPDLNASGWTSLH